MLFFNICFQLFISSSCLISKASKNVTSRTDSEPAYLVSNFNGNASYFTRVTHLQIVSD